MSIRLRGNCDIRSDAVVIGEEETKSRIGLGIYVFSNVSMWQHAARGERTWQERGATAGHRA